MHVQDADAVAGELGRLLVIVLQHGVNGGLLPLREAAARIPDADLHIPRRRFRRGNGDLAPVAHVLQAVKQSVFHNRLQDEVGHLRVSQFGVDVILAAQLRIAVAHQLHVRLQQLHLVVQCHHGPVHLHADAEEIHQTHQQIRHLLVPIQLGLDADGVQRIIEEVWVDLTFQVQHGQLLLHQLRTQYLGIFQREVEGQRHQRDAHAGDEPGVVQSLQYAHHHLNEQGHAHGLSFLSVDFLPVCQKQPGAQQQVKRHRTVGHHHVRAGGIVALRCHGVGKRQQKIAQHRHRQEDPGRQIQLPGLPRFLLHQNSDILIEQVNDHHHGAQEQPVQDTVEQLRHGVQMVHRVDCGSVQSQIRQHRYQQQRKGPVQRCGLLLR